MVPVQILFNDIKLDQTNHNQRERVLMYPYHGQNLKNKCFEVYTTRSRAIFTWARPDRAATFFNEIEVEQMEYMEFEGQFETGFEMADEDNINKGDLK